MVRLQQTITEEKYQNTHIGTINLDHHTSSTKIIMDATMQLYERVINKELLTRRINVTANNVINVSEAEKKKSYEQIDLFTDYNKKEKEQQKLLFFSYAERCYLSNILSNLRYIFFRRKPYVCYYCNGTTSIWKIHICKRKF